MSGINISQFNPQSETKKHMHHSAIILIFVIEASQLIEKENELEERKEKTGCSRACRKQSKQGAGHQASHGYSQHASTSDEVSPQPKTSQASKVPKSRPHALEPW